MSDVGASGLESLQRWVVEELRAPLSLTQAEAECVARACCRRGAGASPGDAASAASIARAVKRLRVAGRWWEEHRVAATDSLFRGEPGEVEIGLAEALAPPAPDLIDVNWPDWKLFSAVPLAEGVSVGDDFLVGDGMGRRSWAKVVDRDGRLGVVLDRYLPNPLDELYASAWHEAIELMRP